MKSYNSRNLSLDEIINTLNKVSYCRLGICSKDNPYVISMSFTYKGYKDGFKFIFKSSNGGMKIRYLEKNNKACIEFDRNIGNAIDSVIAFGEVKILNDPCEEKSVILEVITSSIEGRRVFLKA